MAEEKFKMLLEYKDGFATWNVGNEESIVYLLVIGQEQYVGSTYQPKNRLRGHLRTLLKNKHANSLIQNAFNKEKSLKAYVLEDCGCYYDTKRLKREKYYISKMNPSLNREMICKIIPYGNVSNKCEHEMLGDAIRLVRKRRNIGLKELAERVSTEWRLIRDFEKGRTKLSYQHIDRLMKELDFEIIKSNSGLCIKYNIFCVKAAE